MHQVELPAGRVVRTLRWAFPVGFTPHDLDVATCDLLEEAALQNGDVGFLEEIWCARCGGAVAKAAVLEVLRVGYAVRENEHAGALSERRRT